MLAPSDKSKTIMEKYGELWTEKSNIIKSKIKNSDNFENYI